MTDVNGVLCCCEYYDLNQERNHILACCCNCEDLDQAFDNIITSHAISHKTKKGIINTMQDRLRIPWKGGAKQVAFDAVMPVFILPLMLLIASMSLWWTIFSFTTVAIFLGFISNFLIKAIPRTKFFFMWTLTSIVILYIIFEFIVIPFLEILLEENIALSIFIFGFIFCLYLMKSRTKNLCQVGDSEAEIGFIGKNNRLHNCSICQKKIPDKDHHCVWFDCCVGKHNQCLFISALFFAVVALLYSSNLTLTSVCHPFKVYKTILLPDDCSEVYILFELGLSFVAAVYSLILACLLLVLLLQQLVLVSLGITLKEWTRFHFTTKLCLGLTAKRQNNRGFLNNWKAIICSSKYNYSPTGHT
ncbi:zinc finger DHHC-type palmitoyltransferase GABPI [Leptinotarsa decemlineata]|uniref:zinc finger DHHC-type palmitoyltransferase GABPI n=1 Tax=Leptinotarsa decemlineata TaxID=7539 RepID=UPI003D309296